MTMYADTNFPTKKALKEAVLAGAEPVRVFSAGIGSPPDNGVTVISGPHYPQPHKWYARVLIVQGVVSKVLA